MKEIYEKIHNLNNLIDKINDDRYSEIFNTVGDILESLTTKVDEVISKQEYLEENLEYMDDDIINIQDELFEEVDFDDINDEYVEVYCEHCGKPLFVEKDALNSNKKIPCPFCNENVK